MITERRVKKLHDIHLIKAEMQKVNESDSPSAEKEEVLSWLNIRLKVVRASKRESYEKRKKKITEYKIYVNEEQNEFLLKHLERFQEYAKNPDLEIKDLLISKIFSEDALNKEEVQRKQEEVKQLRILVDTTRDILRKVGGASTNFNQLLQRINEGCIIMGKYKMTPEDINKALDTIQVNEDMLIELTNYYNLNKKPQ